MNFKKVVVLPPGATSTASRRKPTPAAEQARLVALWQQSGLSAYYSEVGRLLL